MSTPAESIMASSTPFPDSPDVEARALQRALVAGQRAYLVDGDPDRWLVESASAEGAFYLVTFRPGRRCPCRASTPHCSHAALAAHLRRLVVGVAASPAPPARPVPRPGLRAYRAGADPTALLVQAAPEADLYYLIAGAPPSCACGGHAGHPCPHLAALPGTGPLTDRIAARTSAGERLRLAAVACAACGQLQAPGAAVRHLERWYCPSCGAEAVAATKARGRDAMRDLYGA